MLYVSVSADVVALDKELRRFLADECETAPTYSVLNAKIRDAFTKSQEPAVSARAFSLAMLRCGQRQVNSRKNGRRWAFLRLASPAAGKGGAND